jgi:UDP-N-acetylmuramoyl-L-alanyl-D-glutamate--2,6-diaminopimelate ligase
MKFLELTEGLGLNIAFDFEVKGIAIDSREVKEGFVFFALKGEKSDGVNFIESAIKNGAKAIFSHANSQKKFANVNFFTSPNIAYILNHICKVFYSPIPQNLLAVTGTNGKTSVANFTASLLTLLGSDTTSIGTLGTLLYGDFDKQLSYSGLTSPDIINLMKDLNGIKKQGIDFVAMEASSHGLHQHRLGGLLFKTAAFTNFTQDHLDYHGTMDKYFNAKMILFKEYMTSNGNAVLNADIPEYEKIKTICEDQKLNIISYGKNGEDIKIKNINLDDKGLILDVDFLGKNKIVETNLIGEFQAYNLACSMAMVASFGFEVDKICEKASLLKPVKGRMDVIFSKKHNAKVVIDYAHTPDALEKAISSLRKQTSGRLITIFGCGGDRDKTKRPLMGKIADEMSDIIIVTDDNPRTEKPEDIRKDIMVACKKALEVENRKKAIAHGISILREGDSILLAGKGHEDYQIIGKEKLPFDEFKIVKEILES